MKWDRIEYDDASGYYWQLALGVAGEVYVDGVSGQWAACWFSGGHDVEISRHDTECAAKAAAEQWLRVMVVGIENALSMNCIEPQDDGN